MGEEETSLVSHNNNTNKVDPMSALRESVSFGRYVSDSLDWGKWSSFNQNKYLEEAQKFSSRGSVAQKRALIEAHYKKIAAKKAAALPEQETSTIPAELDNVKKIDDGRCSGDSASEPAEFSSNGASESFEDHGTEFKDFAVDDGQVELGTQTKEAKNEVEIDFIDNYFGKAKNDVKIDFIDNYFDKDEFETGTTEEVNPPQSETQLSAHEEFEDQNKDVNVEHNRSIDLQKASFKEISASLDRGTKYTMFGSSFLKRNHKALSSPLEAKTPVLRKKETTSTPNSKNSAKLTKSNSKTTPKASPMQANRPSLQKGQTTLVVNKPSPTLERVWNSKSTFSCFKAFQDVSDSHITPTKTNNGRSKVASANSRGRKTPEKFGPETRISDATFDAEKISSISGRRSCVSQVVSSFCFRSEERAERRKEYFMKLEERLNAEKLERHAKAKEKAENELKLLRQCLGFKARPMPDFYHKIAAPKVESSSKRTKS